MLYEIPLHTIDASSEWIGGVGGILAKLTDGKEVKMEVSVGQKVIYSKYAGTEVKLEDEEYIIVRQSDILAVVE